MFTTPINITPSKCQIDFQSKLLMLGSCFTENIGYKLYNSYFDVDVNPFGVLYNPISIANSIDRLIGNKIFTSSDLFQHASLWRSFMHDTSFAATNQNAALNLINERFEAAVEQLKTCDYLILTLGTAWTFENIKTENVVANCHKLPANQFTRKRLTVAEITNTYSSLLKKLLAFNPKIQIIFSVSPIRHWKDGAHENNLSKSILHLSIEAIQHEFEYVNYFPAYEIVMDELRDYRFYATDMFHPSEVAIQYIWERFCDNFFSVETRQLLKRLNQLSADMAHRPLHADTEEYVRFLENTKKRRTDIIADFPFLADRINR